MTEEEMLQQIKNRIFIVDEEQNYCFNVKDIICNDDNTYDFVIKMR